MIVSDIARGTGIGKASCHRILQALSDALSTLSLEPMLAELAVRVRELLAAERAEVRLRDNGSPKIGVCAIGGEVTELGSPEPDPSLEQATIRFERLELPPIEDERDESREHQLQRIVDRHASVEKPAGRRIEPVHGIEILPGKTGDHAARAIRQTSAWRRGRGRVAGRRRRRR